MDVERVGDVAFYGDFYYFNFPLWLNLFLGQTIGAVIFFKLDKLIFSKK